MKFRLAALAVALFSLWAGAYVMHLLSGTWAAFPFFTTWAGCCGASAAVAVFGPPPWRL